MAIRSVDARRFIGRELVVWVPPMIATRVGRIDAELLDSVDGLEHAFDLGPAGKAQKNLAARPHIRRGREGFAGQDSTQDVDPRDDRAGVVRRPPDIDKDAAGRETLHYASGRVSARRHRGRGGSSALSASQTRSTQHA
jgi:hypothetical protein